MSGDNAVPIEDQIQAALLAAFSVEPGMGGPAEPVWETYRPEGVAIVLTNAVLKVVNPWAENLIRVAVEAALAALRDATSGETEQP